MRSWAALGRTLGALGPLLGALGPLLGVLGPPDGPSWCVVGVRFALLKNVEFLLVFVGFWSLGRAQGEVLEPLSEFQFQVNS